MKTKNMTLVALFAALTAIGAFIRIPLSFVDGTMQVFFVIMAGALLGKKLGAYSQILYIAIGLIGLPIFTKGGGPTYILQPSFGYLLSYPVAAYVVGLIMEKIKGSSAIIFSVPLSLIIIYGIGVPYLYFILTYINGIELSWKRAMEIGMLLFLPWDILKGILAIMLSKRILPLVKI